MKLSRFYLVRLQMIETMFNMGQDDRAASLTGFTLEQGNIRACLHQLDHIFKTTGSPESARLYTGILDSGTETIARFLPFQEQKEWHEIALGIAKATGNLDAQHRHAHNLALIYSSIGEMKKAVKLQKQSLSLAKKSGNPTTTAKALNSLGQLHLRADELELAKKCYDEFFSISEATNDLKELSYAMGNIGQIYHRLELWADADEAYRYALEISMKLKDRFSECTALCHLGDLHFDLRRYPRSREYYEKALMIAKEEMNTSLLDSVHQGLGNISFRQKRYPDAKAHYQLCYQFAQEDGRLADQAVALGNIGNIYFKICEFEKARQYYERQMKIGQMLKSEKQIADSSLNIGLSYLTENRKELAFKHISKSAVLYAEMDIPKPMVLQLAQYRFVKQEPWLFLFAANIRLKICRFVNRKYKEI